MKSNSRLTAYRLNEGTLELVAMLAEKEHKNKTQIIEEAIYAYASRNKSAVREPGTSSGDTRADEKTITFDSADKAAMSKQYDKLLLLLKAIDESCFHQLNLLNTICDNIASPDFDTYSSAASAPTAWLDKSVQERRNTILNHQTKAMLSAGSKDSKNT